MINTSITYKTPTTTLPIFQVTEADVAEFDAGMGPEDVGTWCFWMGGTICGFYPTREECEERVANLLAD